MTRGVLMVSFIQQSQKGFSFQRGLWNGRTFEFPFWYNAFLHNML